MIRKRHTPERQHTAPQTCWPALVVQVITAGHPGPEVRLATRAGLPASALFPPRLAETRLSPSGVGVCVASTLCRSYRGFGQDRLCIFSSTSEEYFLFVRELLAFLYIIDVCFMPRLCFFHVILGSPGTLDCL